jgi:preprotein translocase subunit SecD
MTISMKITPHHSTRIGQLHARVVSRRLGALTVLASLFLISATMAEPLTLDIRRAGAGHDRQTGKSILEITVANAQALARFATDNVGRKMDLRIDGISVLTTIIREPILGGSMQINVPTDGHARDLAAQMSNGTARVQAEIVGD